MCRQISPPLSNGRVDGCAHRTAHLSKQSRLLAPRRAEAGVTASSSTTGAESSQQADLGRPLGPPSGQAVPLFPEDHRDIAL